ncbi:hypothetical protein MC7420_171 [Coleofasciculus chthonoplastes PCC 7420]|uniref:Uncharacterized protein n=2 Tax=Coleofasciculus chthonoplastes TaxID=64178 RepID=B4VL35_9CYAN|nr:hypothetical protein MC7420_171 [Coleofasciculus chthonoplastes PCC 7420]
MLVYDVGRMPGVGMIVWHDWGGEETGLDTLIPTTVTFLVKPAPTDLIIDKQVLFN